MDNIMHEVDLDIPIIIITSTHTATTSKKDHVLPFANPFPLIFAQIDISLEDDKKKKVNCWTFWWKDLKELWDYYGWWCMNVYGYDL